MTGTDEGVATFTPDDPQGATASGHFTEWFGESFNNQNDVQHFTSTFRLKGSDGSHIVVQETAHFSTNANGVITVSIRQGGRSLRLVQDRGKGWATRGRLPLSRNHRLTSSNS